MTLPISQSKSTNRSSLGWLLQNNYHRAEFFLTDCQDGKIGYDEFQHYPYLDMYRKHGLINMENGKISCKMSEQLEAFLENCRKENYIEVKLYLISLLHSNSSGSGKWVDLFDVDQITHYEFNARQEGELSYHYALFLVDLGVLELKNRWDFEESVHLYRCPITMLGREVLRDIASKRDAIKVAVEDGSVVDSMQVQVAFPGSTFEGNTQEIN